VKHSVTAHGLRGPANCVLAVSLSSVTRRKIQAAFSLLRNDVLLSPKTAMTPCSTFFCLLPSSTRIQPCMHASQQARHLSLRTSNNGGKQQQQQKNTGCRGGSPLAATSRWQEPEYSPGSQRLAQESEAPGPVPSASVFSLHLVRETGRCAERIRMQRWATEG